MSGDSFIYEFVDDFPILELPEWIFEEIVRVKTETKVKPKRQLRNIVSSDTTSISTLRSHISSPTYSSDEGCGEVIQRDIPVRQEEVILLNDKIRESKDWDILVELFDRCYKPFRFENGNYDGWVNVGMALKNRFGEKGLELFIYFSNKATIHDSEQEIRNKYDTFSENHARPLTIYTLYHYAKEDNKEEYMKIMKQNNAFGKFELSSQDIKHYIKNFKGHDFVWYNGMLYSFEANQGYWKAEKEGLKMRDYIGGELYESLKEIYFECYFDFMSADIRKKTEAQLFKLKTLPFEKEIVEKTKENLTTDEDIFDNKPYLLGFNNMVYDLQCGEFRKYKRDDLISITTGYDWFEPTSEQIRTMNDLIISVMPIEDERECYLRILATGLCGLPLEKFIIEEGMGRNGKGWSNDQMKCALGHYAMIGNNALLTEKSSTNANPEKANIHKKRYVIFREPSVRNPFNNSAVRDLTGGGSFSARDLYKSDIDKKHSLTCVVECNKKPLFVETPLPADVKRVIDILFRNTFTDEEEEINPEFGIYKCNPKLKEQSFQEAHRSAFLTIIMEAYKRYAKDNCNLKIPKSIKERSNQYLEKSSDLYQWILDNYEKTDNENDIVQIKDMYYTFKISEFYNNLTKQEKRKNNLSDFTTQITEMPFLRKCYFDRKQLGETQYRNILRGFTKKQNILLLGNDDEEE